MVTTAKRERIQQRELKLSRAAAARRVTADPQPASDIDLETVDAVSTPQRSAASPKVTVASIVSDTFTWMGLTNLADDHTIPALPIGRVAESLWLAVRENHRRTAAQLAPSQSAVSGSLVVGADPNTADLTDVLTRPGVTASFNADKTVDVLHGAFTDAPVMSAADAAAVFNGLAPLLGAATGFARADDITVQRVATTTATGDVSEVFYRIHGTIDGMPVLGSDAILVTDGNGAVTSLFNGRSAGVDGVDVTLDKRIDQSFEASALATAAYLTSANRPRDLLSTWAFVTFSRFDPTLVVYALDANTSPRLVWRVVVAPPRPLLAPAKPSATFYIYANGSDAGTLMTSVSNAQGLSSVTVRANDVLGQRRTITVARQAGFFFQLYKMQDLSRGISTYKASYEFLGLGASSIPSSPLSRGWLGWNTSAVSAHANVAQVYDFYDTTLGLKSFDGNGAPIKVVVEYNPNPWAGAYNNAYWDPDNKQLVFGDGDDLEGAVDIVGHEFTHAVVTYVVGQGSSVLDYGESGALNEAYADIMGSLIEGKSGADRWLIGEDSTFTDGAVRNIANPSSLTTILGPYRDQYATRYTGGMDDGGEHVNSTIYSHAAYLMMTAAATSDISEATWAGVFYHSLYRLAPERTSPTAGPRSSTLRRSSVSRQHN